MIKNVMLHVANIKIFRNSDEFPYKNFNHWDIVSFVLLGHQTQINHSIQEFFEISSTCTKY